ncbi:nicotinamide phosphoribosyltransferase [Salmonella phage 18-India]|nr:nicotinamide phosphoribosyltransferase [Salmonella phage 18-India]
MTRSTVRQSTLIHCLQIMDHRVHLAGKQASSVFLIDMFNENFFKRSKE